MAFTLPTLSYGYDALEPHFDARTMEIHHTKHHQTYLSKLNDAIAGTSLEQLSLEELIKQIDAGSPAALRNNGGGVYNHNLFWSVLAPPTGRSRTPNGSLAAPIQQAFGSFQSFKEKFAAAAVGRFGSGWVWLGVKGDKTLCLCSTPNQDNPLMKLYQAENDCTPILGLDVWEHAYYLKYQNRRPDYIKAFWEVVNWQQVEKHFAALQ